MSDIIEHKAAFLERIREYNHKYELSKTVGPDYYEPGMSSIGAYIKADMANRQANSGRLREAV